jgi:hypothetical protein
MVAGLAAACCNTRTISRKDGIFIEKKGTSLKVAAKDADPAEVLNAIADAMEWQIEIEGETKVKITYTDTEFYPAEDVLYRVADEAALSVTREGKGKYKIEYVPTEDDTLSEEELAKKYRTTINSTRPASGIETGYFIYEGHYVPPPYEITIGKNEVFINGLVVEQVHSQKPKRPVSVPDEQNIISTDELYNVVHHKYDQWKSAHGKKTALRTLKEFLNNNLYVQKNVLKFEVGDDQTVWFTFKKKDRFGNQEEEEILLAPLQALPLSDEEVEKMLSQESKRLSEYLRGSGLILCFDKGNISLFLPSMLARQFLESVCEIIDSNKETHEKEYSLTKKFVTPESAKKILYNFDTAIFRKINPAKDTGQ